MMYSKAYRRNDDDQPVSLTLPETRAKLTFKPTALLVEIEKNISLNAIRRPVCRVDSRGGRVDGGVTGHADSLQCRSNDQRPLPPDHRQLNGKHCHDRTENSRKVDIDVLSVRLGDRDLTVEVSSLQNNGQERTGNVERPEVSDVGDPEDDGGKGHDLQARQ